MTLEPVDNMTNWIRGKEELHLLQPRQTQMSILGLGGSVGSDVSGKVVVFESFDEMEKNSHLVRVFCNLAFSDRIGQRKHRSLQRSIYHLWCYCTV